MDNHVNNGFSDEELGFDLLTNRQPQQQQQYPQQHSIHQQQNDDDDDSGSDVSEPRVGGPQQQRRSPSPSLNRFGGIDNDDDDNHSSVSSFNSFQPDHEAELLEKRRILTKLRRYEMRRGIKLSTAVSIHTSLEELRLELEIVNKELKMDQAVEQGKKFITMFAFGVELMNNKFDPLDIYLDGWSASVNNEIDTYDEILEELYDKYYDAIDASPEVKLIFGLVTSAIMYNISHKMLNPNNSTFLSKLAKNHNNTQMDNTMNGSMTDQMNEMTGPSGGMADEILRADLNALRSETKKQPLVRFE